MTHNVVHSLKWRYACKVFDPTKKISEADFDVLLEALRLSCSSYGMQPWKFVVVNNPELRQQLVEKSYGQNQVKDASHLIVMCTHADMELEHIEAFVNDTATTRGKDPSELEKFRQMLEKNVAAKPLDWKLAWMKNQVYIALGFLLSACAHMRIDSCPMEGFSPLGVSEVLGLEEKKLRPVLLCPVGYRDESDKYITQEKVRFGINDIITYL